MKHLVGVDEARRHAEEVRELRRKGRFQKHEKGGDTVQAFWAMHVEVLNWSGMSVRDYANALLLSPWALRKWHARLDDCEVTIDWWAHLHPSARPRISRC
jgi:hypothetical protein